MADLEHIINITKFQIISIYPYFGGNSGMLTE